MAQKTPLTKEGRTPRCELALAPAARVAPPFGRAGRFILRTSQEIISESHFRARLGRAF
jgi:hypothetical protein